MKLLFLVLLLSVLAVEEASAAGAQTTPATCLPNCISPYINKAYNLDIAFIMETSSYSGHVVVNNSINWLRESFFPQPLVSIPNGVHAMFETYSLFASLLGNLETDKTLQQYQDRLLYIEEDADYFAASDLSKALGSALKDALSQANRQTAPDVIVVISATLPSDMTAVVTALPQWADTTIVVLSIGNATYNQWSKVYTPSVQTSGRSPNFISVPYPFPSSSYAYATKQLFNAFNCIPYAHKTTAELLSMIDNTPKAKSTTALLLENYGLAERMAIVETYLSSGRSLPAVQALWKKEKRTSPIPDQAVISLLVSKLKTSLSL